MKLYGVISVKLYDEIIFKLEQTLKKLNDDSQNNDIMKYDICKFFIYLDI